MLLKTPLATQYSVDGHGMHGNGLHVKSLSSSELRSNNLNLYKAVSADMSVVEFTAILYENISTKLNNVRPCL
jgi:hypothetical protein